MLEEPQPLGDLALAPDECRGLWRQMGRRTVEAPQRREVRRAAGDDRLVDALRPREVLQAELAEIAQRQAVREIRARERRGRFGQEDLATMSGGGDPRGAVYVDADVVGAGLRGRGCG